MTVLSISCSNYRVGLLSTSPLPTLLLVWIFLILSRSLVSSFVKSTVVSPLPLLTGSEPFGSTYTVSAVFLLSILRMP